MQDQTLIQLQVGVKILLKNLDGKYLLLRRNPKKYPEVGAQWDIVGGRIHPGKTLLENLKREIKEETQLILKKEPLLIAAQDILRVPGRHVVRLTYIGEIEGEPVLNEDHDEYRWFDISEIKTIPKDQIDCYFKELLDGGFIKI
jgi:ADP-ribose pyrophosphatase YjhB (NUDIX family)